MCYNLLADPTDGRGLLIRLGLWNTVIFDGPETVLMVLCDEPYDPKIKSAIGRSTCNWSVVEIE